MAGKRENWRRLMGLMAMAGTCGLFAVAMPCNAAGEPGPAKNATTAQSKAEVHKAAQAGLTAAGLPNPVSYTHLTLPTIYSV